jgi:hypothetical protein
LTPQESIERRELVHFPDGCTEGLDVLGDIVQQRYQTTNIAAEANRKGCRLSSAKAGGSHLEQTCFANGVKGGHRFHQLRRWTRVKVDRAKRSGCCELHVKLDRVVDQCPHAKFADVCPKLKARELVNGGIGAVARLPLRRKKVANVLIRIPISPQTLKSRLRGFSRKTVNRVV